LWILKYDGGGYSVPYHSFYFFRERKVMKPEIVLVGVGEMGGVFARGFLKAGHPVVPVVRGFTLGEARNHVPDPAAVVLAVGEKDLRPVLEDVPEEWRDRLVLLQNELLPRDWEERGIESPTVISVWFEKKHPLDFKEIIPSPVHGPRAGLIQSALKSLGINCKILKTADELLFELVVKNLYILTVNIAGIKCGGAVGELWSEHRDLACAVAADVLDIQFALCGRELDRAALVRGMVDAFDGDPAHQCRGRSAPARLRRALEQAGKFGLPAVTLKSIAA
jgi:hypothetical protein